MMRGGWQGLGTVVRLSQTRGNVWRRTLLQTSSARGSTGLTMSRVPGNATVRSGWVCSLGIGDMRSSGTPESVHDRPTRIRQGGSGFRIKSGVTDQRCSNPIGSVLSRGIGCITTGLEVCSTVRPYVAMQSLAVDSAAFGGLSCPTPGTAVWSGGRRRSFWLDLA